MKPKKNWWFVKRNQIPMPETAIAHFLFNGIKSPHSACGKVRISYMGQISKRKQDKKCRLCCRALNKTQRSRK